MGVPAVAGATIVAVPELDPDNNNVFPAARAKFSLLVH